MSLASVSSSPFTDDPFRSVPFLPSSAASPRREQPPEMVRNRMSSGEERSAPAPRAFPTRRRREREVLQSGNPFTLQIPPI